MMETLNKIKLAVVGIAGAITAVFGWMGWLVIGFAACMLLDWITGSVAGSKKDGWSSATARAGLTGIAQGTEMAPKNSQNPLLNWSPKSFPGLTIQ